MLRYKTLTLLFGMIKNLYKFSSEYLQKRPTFMLPWLILTAIGLFINFIRAICIFLAYLFTGTDLGTIFILLPIGLLGFGKISITCIHIYSILNNFNSNFSYIVLYITCHVSFIFGYRIWKSWSISYFKLKHIHLEALNMMLGPN